MAIGAVGLGFDSRAGQVGQSVIVAATFHRSSVLARRKAAEIALPLITRCNVNDFFLDINFRSLN